MTLVKKLKDPEWLAQTAGHLLTVNLPGLAVQLAKTLTQDRTLAADLVEVFCRAMEQASGQELSIKLKQPDWAALDLSQLDPHFPSHHPLFRVALDKLLEAVSVKFSEPVALERQVRQEFAQAFHESVRRSDKSKLKDYLSEFKQAYDLPEGQLREHTNQVLLSVSDPLPIDPSTTLKQMYVQPLAIYQYITDENKENQGKEELGLLPQLAQVLQDSREPVVVHGQPGHGKSSAMKMLVHATLAALEPGEDPPTVLFLEFKNLGQLNRNELTILKERCPFIQSESFFYDRKTLLILDGMDERQVTDNADGDLKEFVRMMLALAQKVNKRPGSRLNLVVTGRSQYFQAVQGAFQKYHVFELLDFDQERIEIWLTKFNQQKKPSEDWTYQRLHDCQFGELMGQPILLTMVGLLISDPKHEELIREMDKVNRASVYETIIRWTYQKRWHEDKMAPAMEEEAFIGLLQAVAFCMFCRGSENIKLNDLKEDLERHQDLLEVDLPAPERLDVECRNLAISFFFKGLEDKAFSFIHKSFGDFLLVRAMFETLKRLGTKFKPNLSNKAKPLAEDLYALLGNWPLSEEDHGPFMEEMAANAREDSKKLVLPLSEFFRSAQSHHYLVRYGKYLGYNPLVTEASVLSGTLTWLVVCNLVQEKPDGLELFEGPYDFDQYLSLLNASPVRTIQAFPFLDLRGFHLVVLRLAFSNLNGANLGGANLGGASLLGANLGGANLEKANLAFSNLARANLAFSNLDGANLDGANLGYANLFQTDLNGICNWQSIRGLETARIEDVINPPEGFLEHVKRLQEAAAAKAQSEQASP